MKNFTPPLIKRVNPVKGIKKYFFSNRRPHCYYEARGRNENIHLLWIEAKLLGSVKCYPCVMGEDGDYMIFHTVKTKETKQENAMFLSRWNLFVNENTIHTDFDFEELESDIFFDKFRYYQKRYFDSQLGSEESDAIEDGERPALEATEPAVLEAHEESDEQAEE